MPAYGLEVTYGDQAYPVDDPYRFWPTLGEVDLHLIVEGTHEGLLATTERYRQVLAQAEEQAEVA